MFELSGTSFVQWPAGSATAVVVVAAVAAVMNFGLLLMERSRSRAVITAWER